MNILFVFYWTLNEFIGFSTYKCLSILTTERKIFVFFHEMGEKSLKKKNLNVCEQSCDSFFFGRSKTIVHNVGCDRNLSFRQLITTLSMRATC